MTFVRVGASVAWTDIHPVPDRVGCGVEIRAGGSRQRAKLLRFLSKSICRLKAMRPSGGVIGEAHGLASGDCVSNFRAREVCRRRKVCVSAQTLAFQQVVSTRYSVFCASWHTDLDVTRPWKVFDTRGVIFFRPGLSLWSQSAVGQLMLRQHLR